MDDRQLSVIKTLSYSDVFNCPLTLDEIYYFLETENSVLLPDLKKTLALMFRQIITQDGYFAFGDKKHIISHRFMSEEILKGKILLARKIGRVIMNIPSVQFVGISGGVAGGSAAVGDDIDLFVITENDTLYTTRFLLLALLQLKGRRRKRGDDEVKDTVCLNMLIDKSSILFIKDRQNLYTAREIAQVIPLFERDNMYQAFLQSNSWTQKFLPNAMGRSGCASVPQSSFPSAVLKCLEPFLRITQEVLIKRHSTNEVIEKSFLAFHPNDMKVYILTSYRKTLHHYIKSYTA